MKAIIFGSKGYIGMHLAAYASELGWEIRCSDVDSDSLNPTCAYQQIDIRNKEAFENIDLDVDYIFFFSGITGTGAAFERYDDFIDINQTGLMHLLNAIRSSNSKARLIFPSTRLVYKGEPGKALAESDEKAFKTIYALNKFFCEQVIEQYGAYFGLNYTIFRICVPYGNEINDKFSYGTVGFFIDKALQGKNIVLYGDGLLTRTFTYVGDICKIIFKAVQMPDTNRQIYNIGGEPRTLKNVAEMIAGHFGVATEFTEWPVLDKKLESGDTVFSSAKLEKLTGMNNSVDIGTWIQQLPLKK